MASSRKKQDEKNLKTLRELGALPQNKYCFDCNQRGPTYVDVTIGSFVCTKCSGMLRGLTPPHRVKSISMATFTTEEIELLRNRGNEYCKLVWLGLHDESTRPLDNSDEQTIRDFMIDKYERKRYYLDPAQALRNGYNNNSSSSNNRSSSELPRSKPLTMLISDPKPIKLNGNTTETTNRKRPEVKNSAGFAVNFDNADIFASTNNNTTTQQQQQQQQIVQQQSFANFDDNPVFDNTNSTAFDNFSIFDLKFTNSGPVLNQVPLFPKCNTNRWSMPTPPTFDKLNMQQQYHHQQQMIKMPAPPSEDKYAALKDLDNALKSQQNTNTTNVVDWNSSGSNGSLYSSPTPSGSVYSSSSPQSSMFGSPSQGQFINVFQTNNHHQHHADNSNGFANPFSNGNNGNNGLGSTWGNNGSAMMGNNHHHQQQQQHQQQPLANPFRDPVKAVNGFSSHQTFQPAVFPIMATNGSPWVAANPFKVGTAGNANSNNPFL